MTKRVIPMSWNRTHRRWAAVREIEALAAAGCTELPWNDEYAAVFGDRDGLADALRYRVELARTTQLDPDLNEDALEEQRRRLDARHADVLRMLRHHAEGRPTGAPRPSVVGAVPTERASA